MTRRTFSRLASALLRSGEPSALAARSLNNSLQITDSSVSLRDASSNIVRSFILSSMFGGRACSRPFMEDG
jgi:hypothetical protein